MQRGQLPIALLALTAFVLLWGTTPELLAQRPPACEGPLREESLTQLLKSGVQEEQIKQVIRDCGVDFSLTDEVEQRLRALGASDGVILAVLGAQRATPEEAPKPAERVEPSPTEPARELAEVILERTLAGHTSGVNDIAFSPDGRWVASASSDNTVKLWEVTTGQELRTLTGHTGDVMDVAFSPDGRWVASGSWDKTAILWETETGQRVRIFSGHRDVSAGFVPAPAWVNAVAFSPDGRWLATASNDHTCKIWEVATGREVRTLGRRPDGQGMMAVFQGAMRAVAFSPDGRWVATGNGFGQVKLWETASGREVRTLSQNTSSFDVAFSPDGRWLASPSDDKTVKLSEVATGRELRTLSGHTDGVGAVAFSPDGRWVASAGNDRTIKLWDVTTGQELQTLTGHTASVKGVAFSPDGRWLASGSDDKTVKLWRLKEQ